MGNTRELIEVISYSSQFPVGVAVYIDYERIIKFYATAKDTKYIISSKDSAAEDGDKEYFNLLIEGKEVFVGDLKGQKDVYYVLPECHPVMIEATSAEEGYRGYTDYYWSALTLEAFKEHYTSMKWETEDDPIESRWEILDFSK